MNVLDLFSGIGGFSLGLERAGMRTVAFCEVDPFCRRVLAKHWPGIPCYDDVRTLTADRLRADGVVAEVICGGFPCQDISSAGAKAGITGERSGLWSEYARLIGELRPRYVVVENVSRLLFDGMGRVLGDLAALRYDAEWDCIPAAAVGAPHLRERVWIVAYPSEGVRNRVFFFREGHGQGGSEGYQRIRSIISARRARRRPPAHFGRLHTADGLSAGLDQIAALGNAVVPQIPEIIGRAIMNSVYIHSTRGRMSGKLTIERIGLDEANAFVREHHRHHRPVVGHLFSIGAASDGKIVGVVIVGRPVSRMRDDGATAEVTRLCTDGTKNACSFLYGAAARAAFALGFRRVGTYILATEPGTSLTAAGWRNLGVRGGGTWSRPSRPQVDKHPLEPKLLFETTP